MSLLYLDIETDNTNGSGLDVFNSKIVTLQILLPSGKTLILKDPKSLNSVKSVLENSLLIGHNLKFDAKFLKYHFGITLYNAVSYTHLRAHETPEHLVCRLLLEKKKQ